jgi:protein-tyrosine phosphatase
MLPLIYKRRAMELKAIYERVLQTLPMDTNAFISHFNATIDELYAQFDEKYILTPNAVKIYVSDMDDSINIYHQYTTAFVDNILYLASGDDKKKTDFQYHLIMAYKRVWKAYHEDRRLAREVW